MCLQSNEMIFTFTLSTVAVWNIFCVNWNLPWDFNKAKISSLRAAHPFRLSLSREQKKKSVDLSEWRVVLPLLRSFHERRIGSRLRSHTSFKLRGAHTKQSLSTETISTVVLCISWNDRLSSVKWYFARGKNCIHNTNHNLIDIFVNLFFFKFFKKIFFR